MRQSNALLALILVALIAIFGVMLYEQQNDGLGDSVSNSVSEISEEVADEIDDATTN